MKRRFLSLLIVVCIILTILTGCGGTNNNTNNETNTDTQKDTNTNTNQNVNMNMNENIDGGYNMGGSPIIEPGRERVVQRNIVHEVQHICPMNTRIINNHIFRHTYQPRYTCCEENVVTNQQCGSWLICMSKYMIINYSSVYWTYVCLLPK